MKAQGLVQEVGLSVELILLSGSIFLGGFFVSRGLVSIGF